MTRVKTNPKSGINSLKLSYSVVNSKLDELKNALTNLRFEGKQCLGKNIGSAVRSVSFLNDKWLNYLEAEEEDLFPYILTHVPKFDPMLSHFNKDHQEQRKTILQLCRVLEGIKNIETDNMGRTIETCVSVGNYVVCFIKNHMFIKSEIFYRTVFKSLKADEIKQLDQKIQKTSEFFLN